MQPPGKPEEFTTSFEDALTTEYPCNTASELWNYLHEAIQKSALATFGRKTSKNCDWFDAKSAELTPVIEAKHTALSEYKHSPSEKTLQALRSARRKVQQIARRCTNEYWQELSHDIQNTAATGNIRGMYEGIKKALGPMQSKTAPPKTSSRKVITDKAKQMERWVEYYSELYSRENIVVTSPLDTIDPLPIMEDLQCLAKEKCREQQKPLYVTFIDLTKAFDLVSRDGLFNILLKIKCPRKLYSMIRSFHDGMKATIQHEGSMSEPFDVKSGVKQGCILAPTLFNIFSLLLKHAFGNSTEGVYMHTRSDGRLFNTTRLSPQKPRFSQACKDFGLTISLKKTNVLGQDVDTPPVITIDNYELGSRTPVHLPWLHHQRQPVLRCRNQQTH
ncbi:hypothetical protein MHYP_G00336050 [Metynnis hypsauchen]